MKTQATCATCKDNKCEIRANCPDDETSTEPRQEVLFQLPEVKPQ